MSSVSQLGYIGFGVSDVEAWDVFMRETIGLGSGGTSKGGARRYRMDSLQSRFNIHDSGEDDLIYLGWFVDTKQQLSELEVKLVGAGLVVSHGEPEDLAERGVLDLIRVSDPTGLVNEISYGPTVLYSEPFQPGRPLVGRFVAETQGAGHVVLLGNDPEGYLAFYEGLLGLQLTDVVAPEKGFSVTFLHANARHHSLAFPMIAVPAGLKRIEHFMVQLTELDDLGYGQDIAAARGQLEVYMGRHSNDLMLSCYLASPSGFGVEYGWGALDVTEPWQAVRHPKGDLWGHRANPNAEIYKGRFPV